MHRYDGAIIAHIGPMFGGKTSALLADVRKMTIAKYHVALFKPRKDIRYSETDVVNHDGEKIKAINEVSIFGILEDIGRYNSEHPEDKINVIAIDEFQFFQTDSCTGVKDLIDYVIKNEFTLIVSGLDLDSDLNPFDNIKEILPYCTHIYKHKAVCMKCGGDATVTKCKVTKEEQELIGGSDIYEPRCLHCYKLD